MRMGRQSSSGCAFTGDITPEDQQQVVNWRHAMWIPVYADVAHEAECFQIRPGCVLETFMQLRFAKKVRPGRLQVKLAAPTEFVAAVEPSSASCFPATWRRCMLPGSYSRILTVDASHKNPRFYRLYHTVLPAGTHIVPLTDPHVRGGNTFTLFSRQLTDAADATDVEWLHDEGPVDARNENNDAGRWSARPSSACRSNPVLAALTRGDASPPALERKPSLSMYINPSVLDTSDAECSSEEVDDTPAALSLSLSLPQAGCTGLPAAHLSPSPLTISVSW